MDVLQSLQGEDGEGSSSGQTRAEDAQTSGGSVDTLADAENSGETEFGPGGETPSDEDVDALSTGMEGLGNAYTNFVKDWADTPAADQSEADQAIRGTLAATIAMSAFNNAAAESEVNDIVKEYVKMEYKPEQILMELEAYATSKSIAPNLIAQKIIEFCSPKSP